MTVILFLKESPHLRVIPGVSSIHESIHYEDYFPYTFIAKGGEEIEIPKRDVLRMEVLL